MTNAEDAVFDPYMGVGSSVIAALMHGRDAYGCDIVPEYVDIARQRVCQLYDGSLRTRPMGKPIYDPSKPNGDTNADQGSLLASERRRISARPPQAVVDEVQTVIAEVDALACRTKVSKERTMRGRCCSPPPT